MSGYSALSDIAKKKKSPQTVRLPQELLNICLCRAPKKYYLFGVYCETSDERGELLGESPTETERRPNMFGVDSMEVTECVGDLLHERSRRAAV